MGQCLGCLYRITHITRYVFSPPYIFFFMTRQEFEQLNMINYVIKQKAGSVVFSDIKDYNAIIQIQNLYCEKNHIYRYIYIYIYNSTSIYYDSFTQIISNVSIILIQFIDTQLHVSNRDFIWQIVSFKLIYISDSRIIEHINDSEIW